MFETTFLIIPWLIILAFWIFVIWAVVSLLGILKEIRDELSGIRDRVGQTDGGTRVEPPDAGTPR